jgi:hypothetical protein
VRAAVPASVPVVGNGDVVDLDGYRRMRGETGCDAVMIGRGALGNPFLFRAIRALESGLPEVGPASPAERLAAFRRHVELIRAYAADPGRVHEVRKASAWYARGLPGVNALRQRIWNLKEPDTVVAARGATPGSAIVDPPASAGPSLGEADDPAPGPPREPPVTEAAPRTASVAGGALTRLPTSDARAAVRCRPKPRVTVVKTDETAVRAPGLADAVPASASAATSVTPTSMRAPAERDGRGSVPIRGAAAGRRGVMPQIVSSSRMSRWRRRRSSTATSIAPARRATFRATTPPMTNTITFVTTPPGYGTMPGSRSSKG